MLADSKAESYAARCMVLDAARRPQWAWALAERHQVVWMAAIMFSALTVVGGMALARRLIGPPASPS